MRLLQTFKIAAKTGATVTLNKITGSGVTGYGELSAHPLYLGIDSMAITTTAAAFDTTFWGCPGIVRATFDKLS